MRYDTKKSIGEFLICVGLVIVMVALVLLTGCCHHKTSPPVGITIKDSMATRIQYRLDYRKGMVDFNLPDIREKVRTRDTTSHLENDYAESDASYSDGVLTHTLNTKPRTMAVETNIPTERVDSIIYKYQFVKTIQEVAMPLSWWQQTQIKGFWAMLSILAVIILWRLFRSKFGGLLGSILNLFK